MKANPGEDTLVLTCESDLERAAMLRWAGRQAEVEHDDYSRLVVSFRSPAEPRFDVETEPGPFFLDIVVPPPPHRPGAGDPVRYWPGGALGRVREVRPWGDALLVTGEFDGDPRPTKGCAGRFDFPPPPEEPAAALPEFGQPRPDRRTVRLPAPGQRVRVKSGVIDHEGVVDRLEVEPIRGRGDLWVRVKPDAAYAAGEAWSPDCITPVGDDPRWVEVTLPEEGK